MILSFYIILNFGCLLVNSNEFNESLEFTRLSFNQPLSRFDALYKCKQEIDGSFANAYYFKNKTIKWIYEEITKRSEIGDPGVAFHRDLFNDSSFLVFKNNQNLFEKANLNLFYYQELYYMENV